MGSRSGVDMLFNNYRRGIQNSITDNSRGADHQEAMQHNLRMSREGACKVPRAKVVRVADLYPSANKQYLPACTLLHQCGDDAGCCIGRKRCGAKTTKRIVLYFNTVTFYHQGRTRRQENSVEKLTFYNHTECECQDAAGEEMPRDATFQRHTHLRTNIAEKICRCPSEYTVRHLANGSCTCDCFDKQRDCIKYKKGNEYFSHNDRLCIEMETCLQPTCDFGVYMRRSGRCPKRTEKFRSWQRYT
ncbi:uncharacterized protein LOC111049558 [Nilaparvata lugens]|uniref:uncharacterized protein LOC111049558 n=2 Tax=Nilaparvata lugens TaxID=108931 RepID=UPI00193DEB8A|nr:uncharacterized protein LOC111049558 [Nilaparvata lugens]